MSMTVDDMTKIQAMLKALQDTMDAHTSGASVELEHSDHTAHGDCVTMIKIYWRKELWKDAPDAE